jgi:Ca-activated chloride channel family protein
MRTIAGSLCLLAGLAIASAAGDGPRLLENRAPKTAPGPSANIRVDVSMTLVPVAVQDTDGRNVLGLARDNFLVFDEAEQRPIVSFGRQDAPVSIGIVFDCSRSMASKFKIAREAPRQLFQQLNPEDEAFLVTVSSRAELRQDFTSNFGGIPSALLLTQPQGETALIDGAYLALAHLAKAHNQRRILIVVSDGGDNNSRYTLHELTAIAREADAQIFAICLYQNASSPEEIEGPHLLGTLASASGGIRYLVSDPTEMQSIFAQIGETVHSEYVIGYYPPSNAPAGKYRKIKVRLTLPKGSPRLQIYARTGYFTPGQ